MKVGYVSGSAGLSCVLLAYTVLRPVFDFLFPFIAAMPGEVDEMTCRPADFR
jgi:hypothetical protein